MITEDNINIINDERIGSIKSSINELRQDLAVNNLRKDLSKLENNRTSPEDSFLDKIERKFGKKAADNIKDMAKVKLKRKILGDSIWKKLMI